MKLGKSILVFFFILFLSLSGFSQNRPPQQVRRVIVTSRYEIKDGKRTAKSMAVRQDIMDSLYRVHTILYRDYNTQQVIAHVWHTFEGAGRLPVKTQEFKDGNLFRTTDFSYSPDSLVLSKTVYYITPGDTLLYATLKYRYEGKNPVRIDAYNASGKRIYRVNSTFNNKGLELLHEVKKLRKGFLPVDTIISLKNTPAYDSLGRLVYIETERKFADGTKTVQRYKYSYNKQNLKDTIETLDANSKVIYRKTMEYNKGKLKFISIFDKDGVLIDFEALRYELYPSRNRQNRIIEY